ncbi:serine hydrolase domain-containing protein [Euryhalocaulis caribicus]|uniref:serine hydrolase domain-containing protein n=1 Tax=Euryhalocaulis caribicus TaxID=1161401 RepID=UPI000399F56A|nr:serine hydrolase domain-containing protein [Euryhalocaulis caribicus]
MCRVLTAAAALFLVCGTAQAETLLNDDFQDGEADGWLPRGEGDLRLTAYEGNISMRLQKTAQAVTAFSAAGFEGVTVSASFAADSLERGEACLLEVSADRGVSWTEIGRIGDGQDDAVTLHAVRGAVPAADDADPVYVRVSIAGNRDDDTCWADNIRAHGVAAGGAVSGRIAADSFLSGGALEAPAVLAAFAPGPDAEPASRMLEGVLTFDPADGETDFEIFNNDWGYADDDDSFAAPPALSIGLITDGSALIPDRRGPIPADHPDWEWIVEPGAIWDEPGEDGWTRAVLPVALQERNANCVHNGVLSFLFGDDGAVSNGLFQITGETCAYFKLDLWGAAPLSFTPDALPSADALRTAYREETAARLPVRSIEDITSVYPSISPGDFGAADEVDPADMTAYGFIADGVHWAGGCQTRRGEYPYCDVLDIPSYSLAKSLVGGLALMRLEKLYPGAKDAPISSHVPACAANPDWTGVTFEDALDMATGIYGETAYDADERSETLIPFFRFEDHESKIELACSAFPRKAEPGTVWAYHTSDTYILGAAMQDYLREKAGPDADLYRDLIHAPLWSPLGLSPLLDQTRRTYDDVAQPFTGWGLTLHRDDLARMARFIQTDARDLVDRAMLDAALQRDADDRGLQAGAEIYRYNNGFWAWNAGSALGCRGDLWIPFLSGFGGLSVALFPNDTVYYYVSDGYDFAWRNAAEAAHAIRPMCES